MRVYAPLLPSRLSGMALSSTLAYAPCAELAQYLKEEYGYGRIDEEQVEAFAFLFAQAQSVKDLVRWSEFPCARIVISAEVPSSHITHIKEGQLGLSRCLSPNNSDHAMESDELYFPHFALMADISWDEVVAIHADDPHEEEIRENFAPIYTREHSMSPLSEEEEEQLIDAFWDIPLQWFDVEEKDSLTHFLQHT